MSKDATFTQVGPTTFQAGGRVIGGRPGQSLEDILAEIDASPPDDHIVTAAEVKQEAHRRIVAVMPEHQQRNALALFAETAMNHGLDPAGWPPGLQDENAAAQAKWAAIKAIRGRSDAIEAMEPIPVDFRDDGYWGA